MGLTQGWVSHSQKGIYLNYYKLVSDVRNLSESDTCYINLYDFLHLVNIWVTSGDNRTCIWQLFFHYFSL